MKTIIVSGGNRGIGLEICKQLDALGYRVILGSRDPAEGQTALEGLNTNIIVKQLDVTNDESIAALYDFVETEYGKLDVLINNAGLGSTHFQHGKNAGKSMINKLKENIPVVKQVIRAVKPLLKNTALIGQGNKASQIPLEEVRHLMDTNLYGPWRMVQAFSPLLQKNGEGRIINISSGMGELGGLRADYPAYRISKASLNALTIMLADELEVKGVMVYAMCPGWVRTDMGGPDAPRTVEEGADTAVWLSTAKDIDSGKFYRDRKVINW